MQPDGSETLAGIRLAPFWALSRFAGPGNAGPGTGFRILASGVTFGAIFAPWEQF